MSEETPPIGVVVISPDAVYKEVLQMKTDLGDMTGLLKQHIALQERQNAGIEERLQNHGTRLGNHDTDISGINARVGVAESDLREIKADRARRDAETVRRENRKAPWWQIVATIIGVGGFVFLLINQYNSQLEFISRLTP